MLKNLIITLVIITALTLAACQGGTPGTSEETMTPAGSSTTPVVTDAVEVTESESEHMVSFSRDGVDVSLGKPKGWEVHYAENGIVLAEHVGSIMTGGELEGVLAHIFVPSLEQFTLSVAEDTNIALSILRQVTQKSNYAHSGGITEPVPFEWAPCEAAYYLLNDGSTVSIVLAVTSPKSRKIVALYISAPVERAYVIRRTLPIILDDLTIDGARVSPSGLDALPALLAFPKPESPITGIPLPQ